MKAKKRNPSGLSSWMRSMMIRMLELEKRLAVLEEKPVLQQYYDSKRTYKKAK